MKNHRLRRSNKKLKKCNNKLRRKLDLYHSENKGTLSKICTLEQINRELSIKNKILKYSLGVILLSIFLTFLFKDVI